MNKRNVKNPGMISARIGERLLEVFDAARALRTRHDGRALSRTDAAIEAIGAWAVGVRSGVYYPTERERKILDGLRKRSATHPTVVNAFFELAEVFSESVDAAEAFDRLVPLVEAYASRLREDRPPREGRKSRIRQDTATG